MRRGPALALVLGLAVVAVLGVAGPTSAHNQIVSTTPTSGEVLTALPAQFRIDTNENLLDIGGQGRGFAFEIRDAAGRFYEDGCVAIVNGSMTTTARLGAAGAYTVIYQLVSADGHTVSGEIPFTWAPSGTQTVTAGSKGPATCPGSTVKAVAPGSGTGSEGSRNAAIPLADVLWIGGILVVLAAAVIVTLLVVTRRRRSDAG